MYIVVLSLSTFFVFFFFNDTATTEIYTLSLHDALPISVERVSVAFRGLQALNAVSVSAGAGEITALVGPNGAGKTTLLNAIGGFCAITAGSILLDGTPIHGPPAHRIAARGVGRAFQFVELFRHMTVLDNLMLGRHLHMRAGLLAGAGFFRRSRRQQAGHPPR